MVYLRSGSGLKVYGRLIAHMFWAGSGAEEGAGDCGLLNVLADYLELSEGGRPKHLGLKSLGAKRALMAPIPFAVNPWTFRFSCVVPRWVARLPAQFAK